MKLPRIPQINDLSALIELLADHKKHLAHLEELAGLHDLLNKKLQAVENLDMIEGMLADAKAKVLEANTLKAEAQGMSNKAREEVEAVLNQAKAEAAIIRNQANERFQLAKESQAECDALHSRLEKELEKVEEEKGRLKAETEYLVGQSRTVSALREELEAKVKKMNEVFA